MSFFKKLLATLIPASTPAPQKTQSAHPEPDHTEIPPNFPDPYVTPEVTYDSFERIKQGVAANEPRAFYLMGTCYEGGNDIERDIDKAFDHYLQGARLGDPFAQNATGFFYHNGIGKAKQDSRRAVTWTLRAAEQGLASAQYSMGLFYEYGDGTNSTPVPGEPTIIYTHLRQDFKTAISWYRKAAAQGHRRAISCIGLFYLHGRGVPQDLKEARYWLEKAAALGNPEPLRYMPMLEEAERRAANPEAYQAEEELLLQKLQAARDGDAEAQFQLGRQRVSDALEDGSAMENELFWLQKAAEQKHPQAISMLGAIYYQGLNMQPRKEEGWRLLMRAALANEPEALVRLGHICEFEKQQLPKALKWYQAAAELNHPAAIFALARWYNQGIEVEQDEVKAFKLLNQAAEMGEREAQYGLGESYVRGASVEQNYEQAAMWMQRAAEQGHVGAACALGIFYRDGLGVQPDLAVAYNYFLQAAKANDAEAQCYLGGLLLSESGASSEHMEAARWLHQAADRGHAPAEYLLGRYCYLDGIGVKKNERKARSLIASAAEKGYEEAIAYLAQQSGESPSPL